MLAQQSALNHETAYATVTLTLVGPKAVAKRARRSSAPPPGLAGGLTGGWHAFRLTVSWLLTVLGAVAPFARGGRRHRRARLVGGGGAAALARRAGRDGPEAWPDRGTATADLVPAPATAA